MSPIEFVSWKSIVFFSFFISTLKQKSTLIHNAHTLSYWHAWFNQGDSWMWVMGVYVSILTSHMVQNYTTQKLYNRNPSCRFVSIWSYRTICWPCRKSRIFHRDRIVCAFVRLYVDLARVWIERRKCDVVDMIQMSNSWGDVISSERSIVTSSRESLEPFQLFENDDALTTELIVFNV